MNSFRMIPSAIAVLTTLLLPLRAFARDVSVRIPDPALEAAIRAALNNPPRDITRTGMETLTVLDASRDRTYPPTSAPIASLEGLELATNLVVLKLDGSSVLFPMGNETAALSVSDLSRLSSLTKLESLSLALNQFTTIRLPNGMSSLRTLVLEGNLLTDASFLSGLSGLRSLNIARNRFEFLDSLAGLTNLQTLALGSNMLKEFSFLNGLRGLRSLDLSQNFVPNLTLPAGLTGLEQLNLFNMGFSNLSLPPNLSSLRTLDLGLNRLTNFPWVVTNLTELAFWGHPIRDFSFLHNLPALRRVDLSLTGMTAGNAVDVMAALPELREIAIGYNPLGAFTLPARLAALEILDLRSAELTSLDLPPEMTSLRRLELDENSLSHISLPAELPKLEMLTLPRNRLTSLEFPSDLPNLTALDVSFNRLESLSLPDSASRLTYLAVAGTDVLLTNLSLHASVDLSALNLVGFPQSQVTIRGLYLRQPILRSDGHILLRVNGAAGRSVQVQRSTNMVVWEPRQTVVLSQNGAESLDDSTSAPLMFFRVSGQ